MITLPMVQVPPGSEISLCPFCDNPIFTWEAACVALDGEVKCLGHLDCAREAQVFENDEGEDE